MCVTCPPHVTRFPVPPADVSCPPPECVNNTVATLIEGTQPDDTARFICAPGYAFRTGSDLNLTRTVACRYNSTTKTSAWDPVNGACESRS